jgi:hypothetical protein
MSVKKGSMQHDTTDFENEIVDVLIEKICLVYKHVMKLKITFLFSYTMRQITKFEMYFKNLLYEPTTANILIFR